MTDQNPFDPAQPPPPPPGAYPPPPGGYPPPPPPGYGQASAYPPDAAAPYGRDAYGRPLSNKSKLVAGLLQIFIGPLGIGRFYTGHIGMGVAQLFTCGGLGVWALIDGILFLVKDDRTDAKGLLLRA
ncbi:MAG: TM2 domain-containing protein [Actinomycetota bacterium]|nr:TM2 domain-containing protein [Actinomycetota bacterium]